MTNIKTLSINQKIIFAKKQYLEKTNDLDFSGDVLLPSREPKSKLNNTEKVENKKYMGFS